MPRLPVLLTLLAYCVLARVQSYRASFDPEVGSYLWNFSPALAVVLFCGGMYRDKLWAWPAPLAMYVAGDLAVWVVSGDVSQAFHAVSLWTYLALAAILAIGWRLQRRERTWLRVGTAAVMAAVAFFLVTNFGSWAMDPLLPTPTGYDRSLAGLLESYVAAIPFDRQTLAAMLFYSCLLFSPVGVALLTRPAAKRVARPAMSERADAIVQS